MFSPVHSKIFDILSDGRPHMRSELHKCCGPSCEETVTKHVCVMRKEMRPRGQDIRSVNIEGKLYYQLVRLLPSAYDGLT